MSLSILISEPETKWAQEVSSFLTSKSYIVSTVFSGKECQLKIYQDKYYALVLDVDTAKHSGLEVLRYVRLNASSVKVILTFSSQERLDSFGLTKEQLYKLGVSDILIKPFSFDILLSSIEGINQFESWKNIKADKSIAREENVGEEVLSDDEFTRINLTEFYSGNTTIFDFYIKLGTNKYIKILHKGDFFEKSRIEKYSKNTQVSHLYFKTSERSTYINFINNVLNKTNSISNKAEVSSRKIKIASSLTDKYIEEIYTEGLKPQLIEEGKQICENVYKMIENQPNIIKLLESYQEENPSAYAHLFLVAFSASVICKNLEWSTERTTELVAFGSLVHDIGLLKSPEHIRAELYENLSAEDQEEFRKHPVVGAEMLQHYPSITEPIRQIVYQHHEYVNGEGYPNGLNGIKIYPLAKIVCLASEFATMMVSNKMTPLQTLTKLVTDRQKIVRYDPMVVKALIQAFVREK